MAHLVAAPVVGCQGPGHVHLGTRLPRVGACSIYLNYRLNLPASKSTDCCSPHPRPPEAGWCWPCRPAWRGWWPCTAPRGGPSSPVVTGGNIVMRTGGGILYSHRAARHAARVEHGRAARGSPGGVVVAAEAVLSAAAAAVSNTALRTCPRRTRTRPQC